MTTTMTTKLRRTERKTLLLNHLDDVSTSKAGDDLATETHQHQAPFTGLLNHV